MRTLKRVKKRAEASLLALVIIMVAAGCNTSDNHASQHIENDTLVNESPSSNVSVVEPADTAKAVVAGNEAIKKPVQTRPLVQIYNFHLTNRCPSCIAIEEETGKILSAFFADEVKQGRIVRKIVNVDDKANRKIAEKYEAFGSGIFVTRVYQGKESTTDLTGAGFKFARNKPERFREILKNQIEEYLK
jgi:hypothetical protein